MDLVALVATASIPQGTAATLATVSIPGDGGEPGVTIADVSIDATVGEALLPRDGRHQRLAVRILIDGVTLPAHHLVGSIRTTQRIDGLATFDFAVAIGAPGSVERWPLGSPWALRAPPPGLGKITLEGLVVSGSGVHVFPLVSDGLVDQAELGQLGGVDVLTLRGIGPGARFERRRVSLAFPPGHGTPRGVVIRRLAQAAGADSVAVEDGTTTSVAVEDASAKTVPHRDAFGAELSQSVATRDAFGEGAETRIAIGGGRPMRKELLIESGPWLPIARELAELEGWHLAWSEAGTLRSYPRIPPAAVDPSGADLVLTARDLLIGTFRASFRSDVPTRLTLSTTEALWDGEPCGRSTRRTVSEVVQVTLPQRARWRIVGPGGGPWVLDPVVPPSGEGPTPRVVQRVVTVTETVCDTVISTKVDTFALFNPQVWRYAIRQMAPPGGETEVVSQNIGAYVLDEGAQVDGMGRESAHRWPAARLVLVSEEFTRHEWDAEDYKLRTVVSQKGWSLQRFAIQQRSIGFTTWDDEPLIFTTTYTRGDGESVGGSPREEGYSQGAVASDLELPGGGFGQFVARTTTDTAREGGFVVATTETVEAAHLSAGIEYRYASGEESSADREQFDRVSAEVTVFAPTGESAARKTVSTFDYTSGAAGQLVETRSEDLGSYLPAAERRIDGTDPATPPRGSSRLVEEHCIAEALESTHPRSDVERRVEWAENSADLESLCVQALAEGSAIEAEMQLPACWALRKGMVIAAFLPQVDLQHVLLVREVSHDLRPGGPWVTTIQGSIRAL